MSALKDAAISVRVQADLKAHLENRAQEDGRTLASYVARILSHHDQVPKWILVDPDPRNLRKIGPCVNLRIAEGWPTPLLTADQAEALGKQLVAAAQVARKIPAGG